MTKLDLKDWQTSKYETTSGEPMRVICVDAPGDYPVVVLNKEGRPCRYNLHGDIKGIQELGRRLVNAPEFTPGWFWIKDTTGAHCATHILSWTQDQNIRLRSSEVLCRIPPPNVLEAMKVLARCTPGSASEAYDIVTAFFALDGETP